MITVSAQDSITPKIKALVEQLPMIAVNAVNRTAFMIRRAEQESMRSVFDRPTPWFLQQVGVEQATLQNPVAKVGADISRSPAGVVHVENADIWEGIMSPHVYGGSRPQKTVEKRMVRAGILPTGWFIMPAKYMPLDAYGNPRQGELVKMLSWLQALDIGNRNPTNRRRNKTQREGASYVLAYPGRSHLQPGIYKRTGKQLLMMLIFVRSATYEKRLPWFETAQAIIDEELDKKIRSEIYKIIGK